MTGFTAGDAAGLEHEFGRQRPQRCDVLQYVWGDQPVFWYEQKAQLVEAVARTHNITVWTEFPIGGHPWDACLKDIEEFKPSVVISHAFTMDMMHMVNAAVRHKDVWFVQVLHENFPSWNGSRLAQKRLVIAEAPSNMLFGTVSRHMHATWTQMVGDRVVYMPNLLPWPEYSSRRDWMEDGHCNIAIAGRFSWEKNLPTQVTAAALFARAEPNVRLYLVLPDHVDSDQVARYARTVIGKGDERVFWLTWMAGREWLRFASQHIDMLLACSLTEGFSYQHWEAAALRMWQVTHPSSEFGIKPTDSIDPLSITEAIRRVYHKESDVFLDEQCELAEYYRTESEQKLIHTFQTLLEKTPTFAYVGTLA